MRQVETASMVKELAKLGSSTTKLILLQGVSGVEKAHFAKHLTDEVQSINPEPGGYRCILELPFYDVEDITYNSNADLLASFYSQIPFLDTSGNKPGNAGPPGLKPGHKNKALSSVAGQSRAEDSLSLSDSGDSAFVSPSVGKILFWGVSFFGRFFLRFLLFVLAFEYCFSLSFSLSPISRSRSLYLPGNA